MPFIRIHRLKCHIAFVRDITKEEYKQRIRAVNEFERQLRDGGYLILKLFLHISQEEQEKRLSALKENYETEWRVNDEDVWQEERIYPFHAAFQQNRILAWVLCPDGFGNCAVCVPMDILAE